MNAPDVALRRRNRLKLLAIVALFLVPMLLAGVMRFTDQYPAASRQKGELLDPPGDLRAMAPKRVQGGAYAWNPVQRQWRILVPAPAVCGDDCVRVARDVERVWQLLSKDADRVDVLWWCHPAPAPCAWPAAAPAPATLHMLSPDAAARAKLPRVDAGGGLPVYVVDPNGFVVLRYAPGSDLAGVRSDLSRLLKLR